MPKMHAIYAQWWCQLGSRHANSAQTHGVKVLDVANVDGRVERIDHALPLCPCSSVSALHWEELATHRKVGPNANNECNKRPPVDTPGIAIDARGIVELRNVVFLLNQRQ